MNPNPTPDIERIAEGLAPWERLRDLEAKIFEAVPPIEPPAAYWLQSDACESFCHEHARDARWAEMGNVGPTYPDVGGPRWREDSVQENISDGIDGYMEGCPGQSDSSEACATCGCTLAYLLTDYGLDQELDHFAENPVEPGDEINGEHTYALSRMFINMTQPWADQECPEKVLACLVIAEGTWAAIEHGNHLKETADERA